MESGLNQLLYNYRGSIAVTYKMVGLLPSWKHFRDDTNALSRPIHFGPEWSHAHALSGMPIDNHLWITDPPASSFPACIAFKCVEAQSPSYAPVYLRALREAVMIRARNIARTEVLIQIACDLIQRLPHFDPFAFRQDLTGQRGRDLFRADWQHALYRGIKRVPTLVFTTERGVSTLLQGYQSYDALQKSIHSLLPDIEPQTPTLNPEAYARFWPYPLTQKEIDDYREAS